MSATARRTSQIYQLLSDSPQPGDGDTESRSRRRNRGAHSETYDSDSAAEVVDLDTAISQPQAKRRRVIIDAEREDVIELNDEDYDSAGSGITIESDCEEDDDEVGETQSGQIVAEKPVVSSTLLSEFNCVICFEQPDILAASPCGHLYCYNCIYRALSSGAKATSSTGECSVCRRKVQYKRVLPLQLKLGDSDELDEIDVSKQTPES